MIQTIETIAKTIFGYEELPPLLKLLFSSIFRFDPGYAQSLAVQIKAADDADITSIDALARKHSDLKDYTLRRAQEKIKQEIGTYSVNHKTEQHDEVVSIEKAVKMLQGFFDVTSKAVWLNTDLASTVTDVLKAAIHIDAGVFTRKCHNGSAVYEAFPAKEFTDRTSGLHLQLAYVRVEVKSERVAGYFLDSSNTTIKTEFRVIEFSTFDSFFAWAQDDRSTRQG